jgi:NTE family protein
VFGELSRLRGGPPPIDILSGTSVGAINACFLAAHLEDPQEGMERLVALWQGIRLREIMGFGLRQALSLPRVLRGGEQGAGLLDVLPITELITRQIPWRSIRHVLQRRCLRTLSVAATDVQSGRTVVFTQNGPDTTLPSTAPPRTVLRATRIGPQHALASAAIPVLFPPVRIGNELFVDGGLRQNTPIGPVLRMGATHVFAIGLSRETRGLADAPLLGNQLPGAPFLLGKVLNAFLLDHVDTDLDLTARMNAILRDVETAFGPEAVARLNGIASLRGHPSYRQVETLSIRPTEDLGRIAADHVRTGRVPGSIPQRLLSLLDVGAGAESDLASYLLFDGTFATRLINLGRADAAARQRDLLAFFGSAEDDAREQRETPFDHDGSVFPPPVLGLTGTNLSDYGFQTALSRDPSSGGFGGGAAGASALAGCPGVGGVDGWLGLSPSPSPS